MISNSRVRVPGFGGTGYIVIVSHYPVSTTDWLELRQWHICHWLHWLTLSETYSTHWRDDIQQSQWVTLIDWVTDWVSTNWVTQSVTSVSHTTNEQRQWPWVSESEWLTVSVSVNSVTAPLSLSICDLSELQSEFMSVTLTASVTVRVTLTVSDKSSSEKDSLTKANLTQPAGKSTYQSQ